MAWNDVWFVPIIFAGLCAWSFVYSWATAPGLNVRDKHVLVSGGTKGVGLAIAKKYAQSGARLSLVGRSMECLERARAEIQQHLSEELRSLPFFLAVCDISDVAQVQFVIAQANAFHARATDHVVHAAVVATPGLAWEQDPTQLQRDMGVTYFGAVNLFYSAAPLMVAGGVQGTFVIVVPAAIAFTNAIGSSAFSGPVLGLRAVAESLRNELLPMGIAVNMYYPGTVSPTSSNSSSSTAALAAKAPETPGSDESNGEFAAMKDELSSASTTDLDAAAQSLFDGLRMGYFTITNSWSGFSRRVAAAGITPRKVLPFEFLLVFFMIPYFEVARILSDRRILAAPRPTTSV